MPAIPFSRKEKKLIKKKSKTHKKSFQAKMNELDSLRQEAETLKNAIRVSFDWKDCIVYQIID